MTALKTELAEAFVKERAKLFELVAGLDEDQLDRPSLCGGWSNRNVLGHIMGFELNVLDPLRLLFGPRSLDQINEAQSRRHPNFSRQDYLRRLGRGERRILRLLHLTPAGLLEKKFIKVPRGKLSLGQLFGDLVFDRAVHRLDIAFALQRSSRVTDRVVMDAMLWFVFRSIDLLNPSIPRKFWGQQVALKLRGLGGGDFLWEIGTDKVIRMDNSPSAPVLTVEGFTTDLVFTIANRPALIGLPLETHGDDELATALTHALSSNALWEL